MKVRSCLGIFGTPTGTGVVRHLPYENTYQIRLNESSAKGLCFSECLVFHCSVLNMKLMCKK